MMALEENRQLIFRLEPKEPYSLQYFVAHSGVTQAIAVCEQAIASAMENQEAFSFVYLYGPEGSGKTHLVQGMVEAAERRGLGKEKVSFYDLSSCNFSSEVAGEDSSISQFVSDYEGQKQRGGVFFVLARQAPQDLATNPHLLSRLLSGVVIQVHYPREDEIEALVASLLERKNLKLSRKTLSYLFRRLPRDPLSFVNILGKISEFSLVHKEGAKLSVVKRVMSEDGLR